jgi:succinoglycan biosynthesis protein ExoV
MTTLHYFRSDPPNFGDEINSFLWNVLIPELETTDDDNVLVGIGTILDQRIPQDREIYVLGTGSGLSPLPHDLKADRFHLLAVRGPLTAALAGLPAELAVTDAALLLRAAYPQLMGLREKTTVGKTIFVPHFSTAKNPGWRRVCAAAGIEFVDPTQDCRLVLRKIASAKLVIAEAMHAAIVADTFRVPWIAVASTNHFSTFKWVDWTLSMRVPFRLTMLPAVDFRHWVQRLWLRVFAEKCRVDGVTTDGCETEADLRSGDLARLWRQTAQQMRPWPERVTWFKGKVGAVYKKIIDPALARTNARAIDAHLEKRVSRVLSDLAKQPGYLSSNEVCEQHLETLMGKVAWLRERLATRQRRNTRFTKRH